MCRKDLGPAHDDAGKPRLTLLHVLAGAQGDELEIAAELQTDALEPPHKYVPWVSLALIFLVSRKCRSKVRTDSACSDI